MIKTIVIVPCSATGVKRDAVLPTPAFLTLEPRPDGTKRLSDASLFALTLMIAESRIGEMDTMVKVVVSLINRKN